MSCRLPKSDLETMQRHGCFYAANGAVFCGALKDPVQYILGDPNTMKPTQVSIPKTAACGAVPPLNANMSPELTSYYTPMSESYQHKSVVEGFEEGPKKEGLHARLQQLLPGL